MQSRYEDITSYTTKDGSSIKELMHPDNHPNTNQSLAEATVPPGVKTPKPQNPKTPKPQSIYS